MVVNHSEGSLAINSGTPDTLKKEFSGRVMRATEGRKDSTLIQHAEGPEVDFLVTAHGIFNCLFVSCERWWIKDDKIVSFIVFSKEIEGVSSDRLNLHSSEFSIFGCCRCGIF